MGFRVKIAETRAEREALFRCRERVYVGQDGLPPHPDGLHADVYDAWPFPDCVNFVADMDGEVVGGLRLLRRTAERGTSADELFDFRPFLDPDQAHVSASKLCFEGRNKERAMRLTRCLFLAAYHYCLVNGLDEMYGCFRASHWPIAESLGAKAVGPTTHQGPIAWVPFVGHLPLLHHTPKWGRMLADHDVREFVGIWTRRFLEPGEPVYLRGEDAEVAYVVVSGEIELQPVGRSPIRLERPWMIGDDEMLEGRLRAHDVVAITQVDLIEVDRDAYFRQVAAQPAGAVKFARLLLEDPLLTEDRGRDLLQYLDVPDAQADVANVPMSAVPLAAQGVLD